MNATDTAVDCTWTMDRLVALQDGELSPGEDAFVREHLDGCPDCAAMEEALAAATPVADLIVPPEIQAALEVAVDTAVAAALEHPVDRRAPGSAWRRWLRRDRDLSNGAILAYGFVLAACLGWGLSNWFAVQAMSQVQTAPDVAVDQRNTSPADGRIAPDQYRPASWTAEDEAEPWR
jgi:anti-sigma factor RsiW